MPTGPTPPFHGPAAAVICELAESPVGWGLPWPCIHEFYAKVTLGEAHAHWPRLSGLLTDGRVQGPMVQDARIAAICLSHGVSEFLTADRDFGRFPALHTRNPLVVPER
jgi:predicted nucleic acid-binding protein